MRHGALFFVCGTVLFAPPASLQSQESSSEGRPASRLQRLRTAYSGVAGGMDKGAEALGWLETALDAYELLTGADRAREPDYSPAGMPRVPSRCADSEACGACYEQAQRKLNRVRDTLERLRGIGLHTKEMKDDAIAVGTSLSSIQGAGLGWYGARRDIMAGWQEFVGTYQDKYRELIGSLETALRQIETCEATHFDEANWFDRFGFIYLQFMEGRYHPDAILN